MKTQTWERVIICGLLAAVFVFGRELRKAQDDLGSLRAKFDLHVTMQENRERLTDAILYGKDGNYRFVERPGAGPLEFKATAP